MRHPRVLLATCRELPDGEPGHQALDDAFARRGIDATWAAWDDPDVAWPEADLVAVRSTWDYMERLDQFLAWAARLSYDTSPTSGDKRAARYWSSNGRRAHRAVAFR